MNNQIIKSEGYPGNALATWRPIAPATGPTSASKDDTVLDLGGVFRLLSRRRRWIFYSTGIFLALAGLLCVVMTPRYKATAQIELLKQDQGALIPAGRNGQTPTGSPQGEDALDFSLSLQTAVSELQSDKLALRVIRELKLEDTKDFAYKPLIMTRAARVNMSLPLEQAPLKRTYILKRWSRHLKVESEPGTRVIDVTFSHPDPVMAAQIVNRLVSDYVDDRYEVKYAAAQRSAEWLNTKLDAAKEQAEESAQRLAIASDAVGIYGNPDSDHGNILVDRLTQLNEAATAAQAIRASKESIYKLTQSGDPELLTGLVGTLSTGQGPASSGNPPYLLIDLRQQEADLNAQFAEAQTKYGPENPKLMEIRNKLRAAREEVRAEANKIAGRARQEYKAAVSNEAAANRALADEKKLAGEMQSKIAAYEIAKNEADSAQGLYQYLLEASKEAPLIGGMKSMDINIIDPAITPGKPASPVVPLYLAAGAFAGAIFGIAGAFVRDSVDTTLRTPEDIETMTQMPVLGVIPRGELDSPRSKRKSHSKRKTKRGLLGLHLSSEIGDTGSAIPSLCETQSLVMEAFRSVRSSILLSRPDNPRRVFMITSAQEDEGKSFSALHLAAALAQNGSTVLLVDADMRRGTLSRNLKMASRNGLSTLIGGVGDSDSYREVPALSGLTFLCVGATPPNPAEVIGSRKMAQLIGEWRKKFDFVVIDSPPLLPVTDGVLLSQVVDGVLLVARFAVSKQQAIMRAVRILLGVRAECFGVVVNDMDTKSTEYGYYGQAYSGGDTQIIEADQEILTATGREI